MRKLFKTYKRPILLLLFSAGFLLTWRLSSNFLHAHFLDSGEAYHKGAGHLFLEDFDAALGFLIARFGLMSFFAFNLLFVLTAHKPLLRFLNYAAIAALALLLVFVLIKTNSSDFQNHPLQKYRLIQQATIFLSIVAGYFFAKFCMFVGRVVMRKH